MDYVLPIIIVLLLIFCLVKNIPAYDHFAKGAKGAFDLIISIFPYLVAIFVFIELLNASMLSDYLTKLLTPVLKFLSIPEALSQIVILRPFSGSGSLALLKDIYTKFGPDSLEGRCASVVVGASDTIFYCVAVYLSTVKIKKLKWLIPVCLVASFSGTIVACLLVRLFMF